MHPKRATKSGGLCVFLYEKQPILAFLWEINQSINPKNKQKKKAKKQR
jgi:hypothetical protein